MGSLASFARASIAKGFFRSLKSINPPYPPFNKGGNYKELLIKSPFEKGDLGGFENLHGERIYGKGYKPILNVNRSLSRP
jgi:hypothetical protein